MNTIQIEQKSKAIISQLKGMTYSEIRKLFQMTLKEVENKASVN